PDPVDPNTPCSGLSGNLSLRGFDALASSKFEFNTDDGGASTFSSITFTSPILLIRFFAFIISILVKMGDFKACNWLASDPLRCLISFTFSIDTEIDDCCNNNVMSSLALLYSSTTKRH